MRGEWWGMREEWREFRSEEYRCKVRFSQYEKKKCSQATLQELFIVIEELIPKMLFTSSIYISAFFVNVAYLLL